MKKIVGLIVLCLSFFVSKAQVKSLSFGGMTRMHFTYDRLGGNAYESDSLSPKRGLGGFVNLDVDGDYHPRTWFHAKTTLRSRFSPGPFYPSKANMYIRQFNISGQLRKAGKRLKLKYYIGDMDLQMTEFTLFNPYESHHRYEAGCFRQLRGLQHFENFNSRNRRRMQGASVSLNWTDPSHENNIESRIFIARPKQKKEFVIPQNLGFGGFLKGAIRNKIHYGVNYFQYMDFFPRVFKPSSPFLLTDRVLSLNGDYHIKFGNNDYLRIETEAGLGKYTHELGGNSGIGYNGWSGFGELGLKGSWNWSILKWELKGRWVSPDFFSPGAQSRRLDDFNEMDILGKIDNSLTNRIPALQDRVTQFSMYTEGISPHLSHYNPRFSLVEPYGKASPNRQGFQFTTANSNYNRYFVWETNAIWLKEVQAVDYDQPKNFLKLNGSFKSDFYWLLSSRKPFILSGILNYEKSFYKDSEYGLDLLSWGAGIDWQIASRWRIDFGYKGNMSRGNDFILSYDLGGLPGDKLFYNSVNQNINIDENIGGAGIRLDLNRFGMLYMNYFISFLENKDNSLRNYRMSQAGLTYTLKF